MNKILSKVMFDIDKKYSLYQTLYKEYYGYEDGQEKHFHKRMVNLIKLIQKEFELEKE